MAEAENIQSTSSESARVKDEDDRLARRGLVEEDDRRTTEERFGTGGTRAGVGKPRKHSASGPQEVVEVERQR